MLIAHSLAINESCRGHESPREAGQFNWFYAEYWVMRRMPLAGGSNLRDINQLCGKHR